MGRIILVRHGETEWNRDERFRGRADIKLNETGKKQAEAVAKRLRSKKISAIFTSPLKRAKDTASYISRSQEIDLSPTEALIDIDYGLWEGLAPEAVSEQFPGQYQMWLKNPYEAEMPEGETVRAVEKRANTLVKKIANKCPDLTTVLVAHKVVNKILICSLLNISPSHFWQIEQSNCGLTELNYTDGFFSLSFLNDTCHLDSLGNS